MSLVQPPVLKPRRWRKRLLWFALLLCILALTGPAIYYAVTTSNRLEQAIAEADTLDQGWRLLDLEAKRQVLPDEDNAAIPLANAYRLVPRPWPFWEGGKDPDNPKRSQAEISKLSDSFTQLEPEQELSPEQAKELRREIKRVAAALAEARKVARLTRGRYPIAYAPDYISTLLPHVQHARELANLLQYDVLLRGEERDSNGALVSCQAMLHTGRSIGDEPTLISMLVRLAIDRMAAGNIERVLAQGQPAADALATLQAALEVGAREPLLLIGARGEAALSDGLMGFLQDGKLSFSQVRNYLVQMRGLTGGRRSQGPILDNLDAVKFMLLPGSLKRCRTQLLEFYNHFVELAKLPPEKQRAALEQLEKEATELSGIALAMAANPTNIMNAFHENQALLRCAIGLVAAERFRQVHHRWPQTLNELVPGFLKTVPLDPFDGRPLKFRRTRDGLVFYSVGSNGADDGGDVIRQQSGIKEKDVGLRLWDVEKRRQPFKPKRDEESN